MNAEMIENTTEQATASAQSAHVAPAKGASKRGGSPKKGAPKASSKGAKPAPKAKKLPKKTAKAPKTAESKPEGGRAGSKTATILEMLRRSKGATLAEIMEAASWQAHSVRGFISASLGKKMGLTVNSEKREDGTRVYRIAK